MGLQRNNSWASIPLKGNLFGYPMARVDCPMHFSSPSSSSSVPSRATIERCPSHMHMPHIRHRLFFKEGSTLGCLGAQAHVWPKLAKMTTQMTTQNDGSRLLGWWVGPGPEGPQKFFHMFWLRGQFFWGLGGQNDDPPPRGW